ncbi:MAG TPA: malto-oligosyltrehalose trehalohydrolase [Burkholderiales bacterium]|nr:malto-oligosyltrehalose trehalohydrolase [Burkholderiales bacterium]
MTMPFGAQVLEGGGVRFRLWAPAATAVDLVIDNRSLPLEKREDGWFERVDLSAGPGTLYRYRINGGVLVPDPASRFQPQDCEGPSEVVDPDAFRWTDGGWRPRPWSEAVLYELHVGTFTPEGTYRAVAGRLPHLRSLGITAIELMPLADFPGRRNWGYDGVLPYAPDGAYGRPDELRALVQAAHAAGLMVFLDVVYNHFGPKGNFLSLYAPQFFTQRHETPWGAAINFDGEGSRWVREFFIQNALYWLREYRFDGLRLDAVHAILDDSPWHVLDELAKRVRAAFPDRHLILENDANQARFLGPGRYTAQWNDDSHHALHVLSTGESDGYYTAYADAPAKHLARCLAEGFAYQGEVSPFSGEARGEPSAHLPPSAFVDFLQNHDQVGNRAFGERLSTLAREKPLRAAAAILLLAPSPPLLFMGEEWGCTRPFLYFCDFEGELGEAVRNGRREEFARFGAFRDPAARERIPDPNAEATFRASTLDWKEAESAQGKAWIELYRSLLACRRDKIAPLRLRPGRYRLLAGRAIEVAWPVEGGGTLLLLANLSDEALAVEPPPATLLWGNDRPGEPWSVTWWHAQDLAR